MNLDRILHERETQGQLGDPSKWCALKTFATKQLDAEENNWDYDDDYVDNAASGDDDVDIAAIMTMIILIMPLMMIPRKSVQTKRPHIWWWRSEEWWWWEERCKRSAHVFPAKQTGWSWKAPLAIRQTRPYQTQTAMSHKYKDKRKNTSNTNTKRKYEKERIQNGWSW